jgi:hypothetical protein
MRKQSMTAKIKDLEIEIVRLGNRSNYFEKQVDKILETLDAKSIEHALIKMGEHKARYQTSQEHAALLADLLSSVISKPDVVVARAKLMEASLSRERKPLDFPNYL